MECAFSNFFAWGKKIQIAATCLFRVVAIIAVVNHRRDYFLISRPHARARRTSLRRRNGGGARVRRIIRITDGARNNNQSGFRSSQFSLNDALACAGETRFRDPPLRATYRRALRTCTRVTVQTYTVAYFFSHQRAQSQRRIRRSRRSR